MRQRLGSKRAATCRTWGEPANQPFSKLLRGALRFPFCSSLFRQSSPAKLCLQLTRKDNLAKNLKKRKKQLEKEGKLEEAAKYSFFPVTYNMPNDYSIFVEEFKKNPGIVWLMKPIAKSQGSTSNSNTPPYIPF